MKILLIQTAFIGDVVLATSIIEQLHQSLPKSTLHFLLRKGNEGLLKGHPYIEQLLVFDKKQHKYKNLLKLIGQIRAEKYDVVINVQRFATTGIITALSRAKQTIGFNKNPFSFLFTKAVKHSITEGRHEIDRNRILVEDLCKLAKGAPTLKPKLYPSETDFDVVPKDRKYVCVAPSSVWFTKTWPAENWQQLISKIPESYTVYLIGGPADVALCENIKANSLHPDTQVWAGKIHFLQSAALISKARMTYTNDSAPMHFASAMNAPVTAVFCSTVPEFGFGPLSNKSYIAETEEKLACRPCGLTGKPACPQAHFRCSHISINSMIKNVDK